MVFPPKMSLHAIENLLVCFFESMQLRFFKWRYYIVVRRGTDFFRRPAKHTQRVALHSSRIVVIIYQKSSRIIYQKSSRSDKNVLKYSSMRAAK